MNPIPTENCNFPGQDEHPLTKTYWQVPGLGDICDPCHRDWLREQERQAAATQRAPQHPKSCDRRARPHPSRASRFEFKVLCDRPPCTNRARYDSGYCGVCDITENSGRGEKVDWQSVPSPQLAWDVSEAVLGPDPELLY